MIERLIAAALFALLPPASAFATYYGAWESYYTVSSNGNPMCGLHLHGSDRAFMVKYEDGTGSLFVNLLKTTWRIPEGQVLRVVMQVDRAPAMTLYGQGRTVPGIAQSAIDIYIGS